MGEQGESAAARYFEARDYRIVERNYRCPIGELDLVVCDGEFLVFVEVKTRKTGSEVHPSLSVGRRKQRKVRQLGEFYLTQHPEWVLQPRFDVIAVTIENGSEKIEHIPNAF